MAKLKIVALPAGDAPESVRKEWVGLVLPFTDIVDESSEVITEKCIKKLGFVVPAWDAIAILKQKSLAAAIWWESNHLIVPPIFVFEKDVCEILPG
jgi:hypothetical protein